ncbi:MAG: alpha/beta fold hydrolase [Candidatus Marsarchaeota archaeon]|nr:alpha/beta fold hydrolase [Candidatus Marsarchaeota archaeon]MCL5413356.1 alpha/beta fold hydrolase [Candidatus Marsarchaeota archaeon]
MDHYKVVKDAVHQRSSEQQIMPAKISAVHGPSSIKEIETNMGRELAESELREILLKNGVEEKYITVRINGSDVNAFYREAGDRSKPTVILIHGGGNCSSLNWRYQMLALAEHFHVIVPDLVGYGKTEEPQGHKATLAYHENFIVQFMDALGISSANFVGNSMGGGISAGIATLTPQRVDRLFLIAPHNVSETEQSPLIKAVSNIAKHLPLSIDKKLLEVKWIRNAAGGTFANAFWEYIRDPDFTKSYDISQLKEPVVLVHGSHDQILRRKKPIPEDGYTRLGPGLYVNYMQSESGNIYIELKDVGHGPQYAHPDFINSTIIKHFAPETVKEDPKHHRIRDMLKIFRRPA